MEQKRILIPGGKIDDCFLVEAAKKKGLFVITSGNDEKASAHKISDCYIKADYSNKEAILKIAEDNKVDYVCSCANDLGMMATAYVCEKLKLPGHDSYETTMMLHNKDRFKAFSKSINLQTPQANAFSDVDTAVEFLHGISQKMIIKPVDGCAGMGITTVESFHECEVAVEEAFRRSVSGHIVVEPFIEGQLHSASCFLVHQKVVFCFIEEGFGKPENPYGVMAALSPAADKTQIEQQIITEVEKVASALRLVDGKIHMNMIVDKNRKVHIVEMHRRCSGDTYSKFIEYSTGIKWNEWIVKAEMGEDVSDFPRNVEQKGNHMYAVVVPPCEGTLQAIHIAPELQNHVVNRFAFAEKGAEIKNRKKDSLGLVHLSFETYAEMRAVVKNYDKYFNVSVKE